VVRFTMPQGPEVPLSNDGVSRAVLGLAFETALNDR
jgi:hypothetical protein